ncbi:hypothetical protein OG559_31045 (plasmid) [Micromonospora sp. NBC_01405]|uniref:hypothetical protein n=1 Tax=Micromonospora sp. NBC_01405 TaxID=2903589 RepID=UPI00324C7B87
MSDPFEYGDPYIEWEEANAYNHELDSVGPEDYVPEPGELEELPGHGFPFPIMVVRRAEVPGVDF